MIGFVSSLVPILGGVLDKILPDKEAKDKAKAALMEQLLMQEHELKKAAADTIKAEAASSHWLAANWRPITMLIFVGLITARWFGYAAPNLSEAEYIKLWDIVELGLGGYMIGRTAEKIMPSVVDAMKKKENK